MANETIEVRPGNSGRACVINPSHLADGDWYVNVSPIDDLCKECALKIQEVVWIQKENDRLEAEKRAERMGDELTVINAGGKKKRGS